jgi:hypothetical protein
MNYRKKRNLNIKIKWIMHYIKWFKGYQQLPF